MKIKKILQNLDLFIMFVLFVFVCVFELTELVPDLHMKIWAERCCGMIVILGILITARKNIFITFNGFLFKKLKFIINILMALTYIFLETILIISLNSYLSYATPSEAYLWFGVLYFTSLIVYPLSLFFLIRNIFNPNGKDA